MVIRRADLREKEIRKMQLEHIVNTEFPPIPPYTEDMSLTDYLDVIDTWRHNLSPEHKMILAEVEALDPVPDDPEAMLAHSMELLAQVEAEQKPKN